MIPEAVSVAQQTATPGLDNASMGVASSFGSAGSMFPIIAFIVYVVAVIVVAQFLAPWAAKSRFVSRASRRLVRTVGYALKGLVASAVLAVLAAPVYVVATADAGTRGVAIEWLGYGLAAFLALAVIGWLAERAVVAFIDAHPDYDDWDDFWGGDEDPDLSEVAD